MSCPQHEELQDYLDDALARDDRMRLESHLEGCDSCRDEVERLRRLVLEARALGRVETPAHDLWPGIEARIARRRRPPVWAPSWISLAAAALLVAALTWMVVGRERAASPATGAAARPAVASLGAEDEVERMAEEARVAGGLLHVRVDLMRSLAERQDRLDPATRELVADNMEILDRAVAELSAARRQNPENRALGSLLATTYQREAALLKQINRL